MHAKVSLKATGTNCADTGLLDIGSRVVAKMCTCEPQTCEHRSELRLTGNERLESFETFDQVFLLS